MAASFELSRVAGLAPRHVATLRRAGVETASDAVALGETMLMHVLGVSLAAAREVVQLIAEQIAPPSATVRARRRSCARIHTLFVPQSQHCA